MDEPSGQRMRGRQLSIVRSHFGRWGISICWHQQWSMLPQVTPPLGVSGMGAVYTPWPLNFTQNPLLKHVCVFIHIPILVRAHIPEPVNPCATGAQQEIEVQKTTCVQTQIYTYVYTHAHTTYIFSYRYAGIYISCIQIFMHIYACRHRYK